MSAIPASLANAMLAGVLLSLCLAPVKAVSFNPALGLPIIVAWIVVGAFKRLWAVPAALGAFVLVLLFGIDVPEGAWSNVVASALPPVEIVTPAFNLQALVSIALPLFLVTASAKHSGHRRAAGQSLRAESRFAFLPSPACSLSYPRPSAVMR